MPWVISLRLTGVLAPMATPLSSRVPVAGSALMITFWRLWAWPVAASMLSLKLKSDALKV
ncbi:hypothetical protein D3C72_1887810 [compost metagenome]